MKKRINVNSYQLQRLLKTAGAACGQFIVPLTIFQGIRTLFFPTTFDVLLLALLAILAVALYSDWI
ncbi:hypothetical protein IUJ58_14960 [Priestia aryabhattai]|uniref:hypothetical protein n=1 Tax=Priestia aryabhattai TaxID=412384 RepID=UPI001C0CC79A|nr:hypothetical protein [Priestia aryabhattai]MBU3572280.1 hypothetical protein [Priestia aryabhattai]WDL85267.1 hypothetical protein IUJ58_14960 [Priestia aryabhattai]